MSEYDLILSFYIDTDGYDKRDRDMFTAGVEYQMVYEQLMSGEAFARPIHRENESRIRMMCGKNGRYCETRSIDGYDEWSELKVWPKKESYDVFCEN